MPRSSTSENARSSMRDSTWAVNARSQPHHSGGLCSALRAMEQIYNHRQTSTAKRRRSPRHSRGRGVITPGHHLRPQPGGTMPPGTPGRQRRPRPTMWSGSSQARAWSTKAAHRTHGATTRGHGARTRRTARARSLTFSRQCASPRGGSTLPWTMPPSGRVGCRARSSRRTVPLGRSTRRRRSRAHSACCTRPNMPLQPTSGAGARTSSLESAEVRRSRLSGRTSGGWWRISTRPSPPSFEPAAGSP